MKNDVAVVPVGPADQLPVKSESDALDLSVARILDVHNKLTGAVYAHSGADLKQLRDALAVAEDFMARLGDDDLVRLEAVRRPATKKQIAQQIAMLLAGFPAAEKLDPAFAKLAAADVGAAEPSIGALAAVARKLRRTWLPEFGRQVPSISEILAALNAEEKRLASAVAAINWMPKRIAEAKRQIEELIAERDHRRRQASSDIRRRIEAGKDTDDLNWSFPGLVDEVRAEMEANQGENR